MCLKQGRAFVSMSVILLVSVVVACPAEAVDGVIEINQARALAGNVTPGDTPGFPVTISQSGSYRLTGNLNVDALNISAINIAVRNVTIDLNGFQITGPSECSGSPITCSNETEGKGINAENQDSVHIYNGIVKGMQNGIKVGDNSRVEKVRAYSNINGIITGKNSLISSNTAHQNMSVGIWAKSGVIINNTASNNGLLGIFVEESGTVNDNFTSYNAADGIIAYKSLLKGNTSVFNNGYGLDSVDSACVNNLFINNNGGNQNTQLFCTQLGNNFCGTALCP